MVLQAARQLMTDLEMIPKDARVLVAVSGGIDSIVLLDVLARLSSEVGFHLIIGHIDHGLRGSVSAHDAAFVEQIAADYDLPVVVHGLAKAEMKAHRSQGREGAARNARLSALEALAGKTTATRIALGHTLDDHAETVLFHLTRGAGPTGLRGIPAVRLPFIRPLLQATRAEILSYAVDRSLTWREDATNADRNYARNRIRHQVLPALRELNPCVGEAVARNARLLADLDEAAAFLAHERLQALIVESDPRALTVRSAPLKQLPSAVLQLVLREAIRQLRGDLTGITYAHIHALAQLAIGSHAHAQLSLPQLHVRMQADMLTLSLDPLAAPSGWRLPVDLGETPLPNGAGKLSLRLVSRGELEQQDSQENRWTEWADADAVTFPLCLRTRLPGDRFAPLGLGSQIKLKDFLINEHAPTFDRDGIPLLCDAQRIIWVVGMRLSDSVKLCADTQRVLVMQLKGVQ